MLLIDRLTLIAALFLCSIAFGFPQSVSEKDGNIFFTSKSGQIVQITSSGLDSDANLSIDGRLVVFVRRTPSMKIDTGVGEQDQNELWIADTSGSQPPRRVLVGYPEGSNGPDKYWVLAGFSTPQCSPDAQRIYFRGRGAATSYPVFVLDLSSGQVRHLYEGLSIEVIPSGRYAGYLIAEKSIPRVVAGRVFRYWLLDRDGKDVGEIGETKAELQDFKDGAGIP